MVSRGYRSALVSTTSALALAVTAVVPANAQQQAQAQAAQATVGLEEIIVTARRVEENIQRVPIAVAAFSPEKLAQQDVKDIWTLTKNVGGLNICCSPGNTSFTFVRGIGNGAPTYFADVPADSGGFSNFFDVSSVQILKGPQGTLFGQASNAGALVYTPRRPGDVFGGYVEITGGNYGRRSIQGAVDVPLIEDRVLLRVSANSFYREGIVRDIRTNRELGDQNYYIIRPSLTLRITDDLENYTIAQYTKSKGFPIPFVLTDLNFSDRLATPLSLSGGPIASDIRNTQALGNLGTIALTPAGQTLWFNLRDQVLSRQIALGPYKVDGYSSACATGIGNGAPSHGFAPPGTGPIANLDYKRVACQFSWSRNIFASNHTTWNFADNLSLKNIFGYSQTDSFSQPGDTDGTSLILFDGGHPLNTTPTRGGPEWSDEIQLQGSQVFGFLDFTLGTFHRATQNNPQVTRAYALGLSNTASITKTSNRSRAVFGQATANLGYFSESLDGLTFTAGYRYTWDTVKRQQFNLNPTTLAVTSISGGPGTPSGEGRFSEGSYTFQLQYQLNPDVMFFINNSKGYSSGGLQSTVGLERFEPDSLDNFEGGVKATFEVAGMTVRTNASYFYGDYSNVKVSVTQLAQTTPLPAPKNLVVVTQNAAKGRIHGLDAVIDVVPTDWLELGGILAYTNTKYTEWDSLSPLGTPVSLASTPFSFVAKWKWTLRGTLRLPNSVLDGSEWGDFSLSANLTHTGPLYNVAKPRVPTVPGNPNTGIVESVCRTAANGYGPLSADGKCVGIDRNVPYYNLDMNIDWRNMMGQEGLNGSFFVTNVTKNIQNDGGCYCNVALGLTAPAPQQPRMFGVRVGYSF